MFKRYLWKLCWLAFALVKRGESMKKIYLVVIVLFFISTKVYTLLHNNIFFCRNSPECDLSHVLPDYREQISGTPLKYTLINTAPLAQVVVRHYELLSQHWSPDDMVTPAQWRHNVDIYIPETAKEHHALVVVNNGINYDKGVQITGKPGDFPQETLASISRDTNTIVISVSDIPNQYLTFQDDKKPLKEDESVSRSWALFMEAPEQRKLMPLNIPMVTAISQAMRLAKKELTQWNINSFIITGISKRGWTTWLSAIADPDVEAIVPFAIDLLDIDASLEHMEGAGMPDNIKEGDRVIVDPYIYCGHCYPCSVGRTNCCENLNVIGVHVDGAMQEVVTHPAHLIHKIPDNVPSEMAPLAEPLTIALHALHRANVKAGEYVAIIGAGAIGLMAALSARHYKATPILIDIVEERLRYAQKLGVPYVLNAADDQVIDAIKNITHGTMAQVVIEASGANSAIRNTLDLASFAGRISFTGWPKQETSLPTNLITYKELDLRGSRTSAGEFDEALRMLSTLEINPQDVVSKVVNLDEIPDAVKELDRYPERYLKINAVFH